MEFTIHRREAGEREGLSDKNQINPVSMNFMMPHNDTGNDPHYQSSDDQT